MKQRKHEPWRTLTALVAFLNAERFDYSYNEILNDEVSKSELALTLWCVGVLVKMPDHPKGRCSHCLMITNALEALRELQPSFIEQLAPLGELPDKPDKKASATKRRADEREFHTKKRECLGKLIDEINARKFTTYFFLADIDAKPPKHPTNLVEARRALDASFARRSLGAFHKMLAWGNTRFVVDQQFYAWPYGIPALIPALSVSSETKEKVASALYQIIAGALVAGELALLRRCPYCDKFFLAHEDPRARFCPGHMRRYYDSGKKAAERVKRWRKKHSHENW